MSSGRCITIDKLRYAGAIFSVPVTAPEDQTLGEPQSSPASDLAAA